MKIITTKVACLPGEGHTCAQIRKMCIHVKTRELLAAVDLRGNLVCLPVNQVPFICTRHTNTKWHRCWDLFTLQQWRRKEEKNFVSTTQWPFGWLSPLFLLLLVKCCSQNRLNRQRTKKYILTKKYSLKYPYGLRCKCHRIVSLYKWLNHCEYPLVL